MNQHPTADQLGLVPATIPNGVGAGSKTSKILVNPITGSHFCASCDFVDTSYSKVRVHRRFEHGRGSGRRKASAEPNIHEQIMAVRQMLDAVRESLAKSTESAEQQPEMVPAEWKTRALSAERQLRSLRRILGGA